MRNDGYSHPLPRKVPRTKFHVEPSYGAWKVRSPVIETIWAYFDRKDDAEVYAQRLREATR